MLDAHMDSQIRTLEQQRFDYLINKQYEAFFALCDDNLRYVHSNGVVDTLASYQAKLTAGYYVYNTIDYDIVDIMDRQDCVIVYANFYADILVDGKPHHLQNRSVAIWRKCDTQQGAPFKLLMYQGTSFDNGAP